VVLDQRNDENSPNSTYARFTVYLTERFCASVVKSIFMLAVLALHLRYRHVLLTTLVHARIILGTSFCTYVGERFSQEPILCTIVRYNDNFAKSCNAATYVGRYLSFTLKTHATSVTVKFEVNSAIVALTGVEVEFDIFSFREKK
jgi:hypothetical protein